MKSIYDVSGDIDSLSATEKQLAREFLTQFSLDSIFVFKSENLTDFWFILNDYSHEISLSCAKYFRAFLENHSCGPYDFLVLSKQQLDIDEIPAYTCKICKKQ